MGHMRIGHQQILPAQRGDTAAARCASIDGDIFPDDIFISDMHLRPFPPEFLILGSRPDGAKGKNLTVFADPGILIDKHMGPDPRSGIDHYTALNDTVRADRDRLMQFGCGVNNGRGVNSGHKTLSLLQDGIFFIIGNGCRQFGFGHQRVFDQGFPLHFPNPLPAAQGR